MNFRRWIAVVMVCVGMLAHSQPASAAEAHTLATVLRVTTSSALTYPFVYPDVPAGSLTVRTTVSCVEVGANVNATAQASAGQCRVSFSGQYVPGATCAHATGTGYGRLSTPTGAYDFVAIFKVTPGMLTFQGAASRGGQSGLMTATGPLTHDQTNATSCYHGTSTELLYAGTFTVAVR